MRALTRLYWHIHCRDFALDVQDAISESKSDKVFQIERLAVPAEKSHIETRPTPVSLDVNVTANVASANVTFFTQPLPAKENNPTDDT